VKANRRWLKTPATKALMRRGGELVERSFAQLYETGGMRRAQLRDMDNIAKRLLTLAVAFNLSLILRRKFGVGTARQVVERAAALAWLLLVVGKLPQRPSGPAAAHYIHS